MGIEVILPRVDMDMTTGRIARWYVAEGETVEKGQPLFEIETDKAAMEIEAPGSGILHNVVAAADAAIPVGSVVAWISSPGEVSAAPIQKPVADAAPVAPPAPSPVAAEPVAATAPGGPTATPLARRLARQHAIALAEVTGSGPRGRVQACDVLAAGRPSVPAQPIVKPAAAVPESGLHRAWLRQGQGRPLVLVHGFGGELNGWRPLVSSLGLGRPVLAVDLPGHGQSAALAPSLDTYADAVAEALAAEGVTEADLVGHSLGAAIAATLAGRAALEVRSLLLLAPAGLGPDINGAFLDGFLRARSADSLAPWLRLLVADPAALGPGFAQATLRGRSDAARAAQAALAAALFPDGTQAFGIRDTLAHLAMPVRVVVGGADRIIPAHHARGLPGPVALHVFAEAGHMPQLEIRPALARILAEIQAAGGA